MVDRWEGLTLELEVQFCYLCTMYARFFKETAWISIQWNRVASSRQTRPLPVDNDLRNCPALTDNKRTRPFTPARKSLNNKVLATLKETMAKAIRTCALWQTRLQKVICSGTGAYKWQRPICNNVQRMIELMPDVGGNIDPASMYTMYSVQSSYRRAAYRRRRATLTRQSRWFKLTGNR